MEKIHRNAALIEAEIDGDVVMMDPETGDYYGLSSVARRIWQLLERPQNKEELIASLVKEYNVPEETCRRDVSEFISKLTSKRVVYLKNGPSD